MPQESQDSKALRRHHLHSPINRGVYCLLLIFFMLGLGTLGIHFLEGFSYIDAFYFTSMIATGQGPAPNITPTTEAGKIFTCFLAFISVGSMVAAFGFLFGPFFGSLLKIGFIKFENKLDHLRRHDQNS